MLYSFDTSAILNGRRDLFRPAVFRSLWGRVEDAISAGQIRSVDEVQRELARRDDDAKRWADGQTGLFCPLDEQIQQAARHILRLHPNMVRQGGRRSAADPFVIALAMVNNATVVTQETASRQYRKAAHPRCLRRSWRAVANSDGLYRGAGMDFLRASGRAAGLSLHPLQPADSSHVCTLRRPSPGWRTLPAPMPTGLTTCSRVLPEDRRILVLTSVSFRGAFSGRPTSSDASVRHSCLSRFVAVADPSFIAWLGLWPGESKEFQLLIVVWPLAGDADPSRRPLRSLRDIAESSQECGPFRVAHSRLDLAGVEGVTR